MTTTRAGRGPVFKIPEHKNDRGTFCRWSHCTTRRPDGWCPFRCDSIRPADEQPAEQHQAEMAGAAVAAR